MAVLDVKIERDLQTLAVAFYWLIVILGPTSFVLFVYLFFCTRFYWLPLAYFVYWFSEKDVPIRGGRSVVGTRHWKCWEYFRDYFPMELVKTAELDPRKNHMICVFPHGFASIGACFGFGSEALGFSKLFPGIRPAMTTLHFNFKLPVFRDLLLSVGACSVSKESLDFLLSDPERGRAAVLAVGGAAESLLARADSYNLVLKERKGFVKIALRNGSPLVPAFSFGENDLYEQRANPKGSWLRWFQDQFREVTGVAPIWPMGRRIFGVIPKRSPVHIVVGAPIAVEKVVDPSREQVDSLHRSFVDNLTALFEQHKHKYIQDAANAQLVIE